MSKAVKIVLIIIAALILLLIVAVVAAKMYFTTDRLKAMVIPKVEQTTGKKVQVGDIKLALFPKINVTMKNLVITSPPGAPFDRSELLSLEELSLNVNLRPLLHSQVQVNKIELTKPRVYLETNKDGVSNYTMPQTPPTAPSQKAPGKSQFALLVPDLRITDGRIEYVDKKTDQRLILDGWKQNLSVNVTDGGARSLISGTSSVDSLSFGTLKGPLLSRLPVKSYQKLTYEMAPDKLTLDSIDVGIEQISLSVHGTVDHMQTLPVLDLSVQSTKAELGALLSLVPKEYLKASQGLKTQGGFQFALTAKGEADSLHQPAVQGTFSISEGSIQYEGLPKAVSGINLAGNFDMPAGSALHPPPGQLTIERLTANLGSSHITGNLRVVNFADPTMTAALDADVNLGEVKDYYPLEKGTEVNGKLKAHLALNGKAKDPTGLKADGRMDLQNVTVKSPASERPLQNLNGAITFNNQVIEAKPLSVNIGESDLALNFTMRNYLGLVMKNAAPSGKPIVTASLTSRQLRTADLPQSKPESGAKQQKASGPILPDMDITASLNVGKLVTEKFQFDNVRGSVRIINGMVTLQNFSTNVFNGSVATKGTLDLSPQSRAFDFNLNLNGMEANQALPKFTSFGNYLFGIFNLTGQMKGHLNDTLGLDTKTLEGEGKITINNGKLAGYPLASQLASFTGISQLQQFNFSDWSTSFKISQGRMELPDLKIKAGSTDLVVNGFQSFDGGVDYRLTVRLPQELTSQLKIGGLGADIINFMKDKDGKISLPLLVKGSVTKPSFSLDQQQIQKAAAQALQQTVRSKVDSTANDLKKRAQQELENLFKKKP